MIFLFSKIDFGRYTVIRHQDLVNMIYMEGKKLILLIIDFNTCKEHVLYYEENIIENHNFDFFLIAQFTSC